MSEDKKTYNIKLGSPTSFTSTIEVETFKFHPYGLEGFRKDVIDFVDEKQEKGLAWRGHDQLTSSWRTPWDIHVRYFDLFSPLRTILYNVPSMISDGRFYIKEMWCADYSKGTGANMHNHGNDSLGWSFCYYIKVPDDGHGLTFTRNNGLVDVNVAEGDLLLFRHPIEHQVYPSMDRRIIISGNIMLIDNYNLMFAEELSLDREFLNKEFYNKMYEENKKDEDIDADDWSKFYLDMKTGCPIDSSEVGY